MSDPTICFCRVLYCSKEVGTRIDTIFLPVPPAILNFPAQILLRTLSIKNNGMLRKCLVFFLQNLENGSDFCNVISFSKRKTLIEREYLSWCPQV